MVAPDRRPEIPEGYMWKELPGINMDMPMPDTWFYLGPQEMADQILTGKTVGSDSWQQFKIKDIDTEAHFMTRESLPKNGVFTTGVAVNIFPNFSNKIMPAEHFARELLDTPNSFILPLGLTKTEEDGPLIISRRIFIMPEDRVLAVASYNGGVITRRFPPTHMYIMVAGNRETDSACIASFETPSLQWKDYRKTAETMMNNAGFNKSVYFKPQNN